MSSSSGGGTAGGGTGGIGGAGGGGTGGIGGVGGAGGGGAGGGGAGGAMFGPPATETVSGGQYMKSANYSMVYTIGQPTQIQETTTSPSYRMQGGIIGANGTLP